MGRVAEYINFLGLTEKSWCKNFGQKIPDMWVLFDAYVLKELGLKDGESVVCELKGIKKNVKILRFCYQNEEYYVVTNDLETTDDGLKQGYLYRWGVEVFHREAKQKLGLEKMLVRSWRRLTNRVGLICVVYGFLTAIEHHVKVSVGKMKRVIQDLVYSTHDGADRLGNLVFC